MLINQLFDSYKLKNMEKTIVKTFKNDMLMSQWLAEKSNIEQLKSQYPPSEYIGEVDLINKEVYVTKKETTCK